ncbi:hypothetical protein DM01DRAFT_1103395, partial [Hesseltinella vesiculosa]
MDENALPPSTPDSSSPIRLSHTKTLIPLQSKRNQSKPELSDGKASPASMGSPTDRKALRDNYSMINFPREGPLSPHRDNIKDDAYYTAPAALSTRKPKRSVKKTSSAESLDSVPSPLAPEFKDNKKAYQKAQREHTVLEAKLAEERTHTRQLQYWQHQLLSITERLRVVDINLSNTLELIEDYHLVMADLEAETAKQTQIDHLMNVIPEKLFKLEQLKAEQKQ